MFRSGTTGRGSAFPGRPAAGPRATKKATNKFNRAASLPPTSLPEDITKIGDLEHEISLLQIQIQQQSQHPQRSHAEGGAEEASADSRVAELERENGSLNAEIRRLESEAEPEP